MSLKLSHSQRELYALCPKKYYYRYVKKLRSKAKGSALPFGTAFDNATGALLEGKSLDEAKSVFSHTWAFSEGNYSVKFGATDYDNRILEPSDIQRLEACFDNLPNSKEKTESAGNPLALVRAYIKTRDNNYVRPLNLNEEHYLHFANHLSMNRKGLLMLESFHANIANKVSRVVSTQQKITLVHPNGHEVTGFIDLLCCLKDYRLPNGRILKEDDVVVADIKSAGRISWAKHDHLDDAPQLDTYLIAVQKEHPTNLIAYFVTSKTVSADSETFCSVCGSKKESTHRTCANESSGKRCGGAWTENVKYFCESKIVIGERSVEEASLMLQDFDDTLAGIEHGVFPRNRGSCLAFNAVCEYKDSLCGKCFKNTAEEVNAEEDWKGKYGE